MPRTTVHLTLIAGVRMSDRERKLLDALRELVEQIESGNGRDDHGHPLKNLKALLDARAIVDDVEGA
jgi:hypothetical protein